MKKITLLLMCVLFIISGCKTIIHHNYIILFDNSKTISEATSLLYIKVIDEAILQNLTCYDKLTIQFIDECSLTRSERIISCDLSLMNFSNYLDGLNNSDDSIKSRAKKFIQNSIIVNLKSLLLTKKLQRADCSNYTDIINALYATQSLLQTKNSFNSNFEQYKNLVLGKPNYKYENSIIIFSDMIQESKAENLDFNILENINEQSNKKLITELKNQNKIPQLLGSKILVYGATSNSKINTKSNEQIEKIHSFWKQFFQAAQGDLIAYGYDRESEIFDFIVNAGK